MSAPRPDAVGSRPDTVGTPERLHSAVPASTYRLQLTADFTLFDAAERIGYLRDLGVDWVYLSPILAAEPGSTHGYDVVDPTRIDEARGGRAGLEALASAAHAAGMGVLVDIVPNHMGIATPQHNPAWWDVLRFGEESRFARWFDIDWAAGADDTAPFRPADGWTAPATGKIVIAELGEPADLDRLEIREHDGKAVLSLHDTLYPVAPGSHAEGMTARELHAVQNYRLVHWKHEDWELNYRRFFSIKTLAGLRVEDPEVFAATHAEVASWFDAGLVDGLRIDHIDGLADPAGYLARLHRLTGAFIVVEKILGIGTRGTREIFARDWSDAGASGTTGYELIAYIDSALTDRSGFFHLEALRQHLVAGGQLTGEFPGEAPAGTAGVLDIAESARHLQRHPTAVRGLFTQIEQSAKTHFAFGPLSGEMLRLARELRDHGWRACDARTRAAFGEDPAAHTDVEQLADVFGTLAAALPVYRVYSPAATDAEHFLGRTDADLLEPLSRDGQIIMRALSTVRSTARSAVASDRLLDYLGAVLTTDGHPTFVRFAQTTGAVMAKGVEDTTFYRYAALTALNEVGGHPAEPLEPTALDHEFDLRSATTPLGLNSLTTHDTKRSEDTRARIIALAEIPHEFTEFLAAVRRLTPVYYPPDESDMLIRGEQDFGFNASIEASKVRPLADASFDILLWQAVVGAWPASPERLTDYVLKAAREQNLYTTWTDPDDEFEDRLRAAIAATADDAGVRSLIADLDARIGSAGRSNSLVAKALQLLAPGVPDVYQGTELWDRSLVDPDNRRPVDYDARARMLAGGVEAPPADTPPPVPADAESWESGLTKLRMTSALLHLRRRHRSIFAPEPPFLAAPPVAVGRSGQRWTHVLSHLFGSSILLVATRLPLALEAAGGWDDTVVEVTPDDLGPLDSTDPAGVDDVDGLAADGDLATAVWRDVLTGAEHRGSRFRVADLLSSLPVAVLERIE